MVIFFIQIHFKCLKIGWFLLICLQLKRIFVQEIILNVNTEKKCPAVVNR